VGYTTITQGLTITVPTTGTKNWDQQLFTGAWEKISAHDHSGGGNGSQLDSTSIAPNFALVQVGVQVVAGLNQAVTIDFNGGNIHLIDVTGATGTLTITLSNPVSGAAYKIYFKQPATALSVTWPAAVKWPQAQSPIATEVLNAIDSVDLYFNGVDAVYYADWQLNYL
jgi:hypothetical protein